jgi:hypothetical protein
MLTAKGRMRMIDLALMGDAEADAILREGIIALFKADVRLPAELTYYEMRVIAGMGPLKKTRRTRS